MASITMTASLIGKANTSDLTSLGHPRVAIVKAMKAEGDFSENMNKVNNNTRRDVVFAAAAAAICCIASGLGYAIATEDPKPGTPEAKEDLCSCLCDNAHCTHLSQVKQMLA